MSIAGWCPAILMNWWARTYLRVDATKTQMHRKTERFVKQNQQELKRLIDARIKMTLVGRNGSGKELFRFSINPWEISR